MENMEWVKYFDLTSLEVRINDMSMSFSPDTREIRTHQWNELQAIFLVNTDSGPLYTDIWMILSFSYDSYRIASDSALYQEMYDIVSAFPGFNFEAVINSMGCTGNETFVLWKNPNTP